MELRFAVNGPLQVGTSADVVRRALRVADSHSSGSGVALGSARRGASLNAWSAAAHTRGDQGRRAALAACAAIRPSPSIYFEASGWSSAARHARRNTAGNGRVDGVAASDRDRRYFAIPAQGRWALARIAVNANLPPRLTCVQYGEGTISSRNQRATVVFTGCSNVIREHMVEWTLDHGAIVDQTDQEFKTILRDMLGAGLVESIDSEYPDDREVANPTYTFADAFSDVLPAMMTEVFSKRDRAGNLIFAVPSYDVTSYDYLLKLSKRQGPLTTAINIINFATFGGTPCFSPACSDVRSISIGTCWTGTTPGSRIEVPGWATPRSSATRRRPVPRTGCV